jgi:hypothetical protein
MNSSKTIMSGAGLRAALLAAGVLAGALAGVAQAQPFASPVGTWDVIQSGPRSGVAQMTFNSDFTITMQEVIVPNVPQSTSGSGSTAIGRNSGISSTRDGVTSGGTTNGLPSHTDLFGFFTFPSSDFTIDTGSNTLVYHGGEPAGQWGFDTAGRLIGFWDEISAPSAIATNLTEVNLTRITNAISFTGRVTLNSRNASNSHLVLVCSTPAGKMTSTGLPLVQVTDISGGWYGTEIAQGLPYQEFFSVSSGGTNLYFVTGSGPQYEDFGLGYNFAGEILVSRRNRIGFVIAHPVVNSDTIDVRAVIGPINLRRFNFSGRGWDSSDYAGQRPVSYRATRSPALD